MKQALMYNLLNRLLNQLQLSVDWSSDKTKVLELIESLKPNNTNIPLTRLGASNDGGYLVPDDFCGIEACFSQGVGPTSEFERHCAEMGIRVFMADKSVNSPSCEHPNFHFTKKFIGSYNSKDYITLEKWILKSNISKSSDLILQMDIEGFEYLTIANTPDWLLNRFRIIIIEFHRLQKIWDKEYFRFVNQTFLKLLQNHTCVHIHPNNIGRIDLKAGIPIPTLAEFTFLRNDRIKTKKPKTTFPDPLDADNHSNKESIILPKLWYKN